MTDLFLAASHFDHEIGDAKVLQGLPVSDVLKLSISHCQTQHGRMGFKDLTGNLSGQGECDSVKVVNQSYDSSYVYVHTSFAFFFFKSLIPTKSSGLSSSCTHTAAQRMNRDISN